MDASFDVGGRPHLSLETVAEIYQVDVVWLQSAYEAGLMGKGVVHGGRVAVPVLRLDRIATIVRLRRVMGPNLEVLAATLIED